MQRLGRSATCPVCKAGISTDQVIPVYARGKGNEQDPRKTTPQTHPDDVPDRPTQIRPPTRSPSVYDYWRQLFRDEVGAGAGGMQIQFGVGFLPWLGLVLPPTAAPAPMTANQHGPQAQRLQQQIFLSRIFLLFGLFVIISAIFQF